MKLIANRKRGRSFVAGTSLIELLVVIVVFLIGILAIARIFPGGFRLLMGTRANTALISLAEAQGKQLAGRPDEIPEQILPIALQFNAGTVNVVIDPSRFEDNLSPLGPKLDSTGNVRDQAGNILGSWPYASGVNGVRYIVGEGGQVSAPRTVGSYYGAFKRLNFGPIDQAFVDTVNMSPVLVYSNPLAKNEGVPGQTAYERYQYFVDDSNRADVQLYLPGDTNAVNYRVSVNVWYNNGTSTALLPFVGAVVNVPSGPGVYEQISLNAALGLTPANVVGLDYDSLKVARVFDRVPATTFGSSDPDPTNPYRYAVLDVRQGAMENDYAGKQLGELLISPAAYRFEERFPDGRRLPLVAKVDYIVDDWRILKEDFRVPADSPSEVRLRLGNMVSAGQAGSDGKKDPGFNFVVSDEAGGVEHRDFLIMDDETGGIYSKNSFTIDKSLGMITFPNPAAAQIMLPGDNALTSINAAGRSVRAMYRVHGDWSVQVLKPADAYTVSQTSTLANAQCYPDKFADYLSSGQDYSNGKPASTKIFFPRMDANRKVSIDVVWYYAIPAGGGPTQVRHIDGQDFLIDQNGTVDISQVDPEAVSLDFKDYGYAIRGVKGASVTVRAMWNSSTFRLAGNPDQNMANFDEWGRNWHKVTTETYLNGGTGR